MKDLRQFVSYDEMQATHQKDVNDFPMVFMFGRKSDEEIKKELQKIGAKSLKECVSVMGAGDVMRKEDLPKWLALCDLHAKERKLFSESEKNLVNMIYSEMCNHEYGYTHDSYDTLRALGKTEADLESDEKFHNAWLKAKKRCIRSRG